MTFSFERLVLWNSKVELTDTDDHFNPFPPLNPSCLGESRLNLLHFIRLDDISQFDIVEIFNPDATFKTLGTFLHIILESPDRGDAAVIDHDIIS